MLMLGRCLPHIVPNVLLAKREVTLTSSAPTAHHLLLSVSLSLSSSWASFYSVQ